MAFLVPLSGLLQLAVLKEEWSTTCAFLSFVAQVYNLSCQGNVIVDTSIRSRADKSIIPGGLILRLGSYGTTKLEEINKRDLALIEIQCIGESNPTNKAVLNDRFLREQLLLQQKVHRSL